jgi:3-deoxy-D-manno-octulosonic-acid transferase
MAGGVVTREYLMRWIYSLVMWLLQPLLRRRLLRRSQAEPLYAAFIEERFGYYQQQGIAPSNGNEWIWVHAVSLGETRAAAALIKELRAQHLGMRLLLTHGTATGRAQGQSLLQDGDVQVWQPWDTPAAVQRFLTHFKPRLGLLLETEVWPNWVAACARFGVPLCLVNARMSEKSMRSALRMAWLARPAYRGLAGVWAQSAQDATRLEQLGARVCGVMGNFKFDVVPDAALLSLGQQWRKSVPQPVVLLASSREDEEQMLLDLLTTPALSTWARSVQWLLVPRHPQRFEAVAQLVQQAGHKVSRRSDWQGAPSQNQPESTSVAMTVWLGDSLGEMALYYGLADVALLGGSFAPLGGQNLIEAAACGCPVVTGPHTFNFAEATEMAVAVGAAKQCASMQKALQQTQLWLQAKQERDAAAVAGLGWVGQHRGAAQRTVTDVLPYLRG